MRLISLHEKGGEAKLEFFGCPLHCQYCAHAKEGRDEYSIEQVMEFLRSKNVRNVYLGGAEPLLQRRELFPLIERMRSSGISITLKTSGYNSGSVSEIIDKINGWSIELKCPLDDVECTSRMIGQDIGRAERYLTELRRTLELVKRRNVRIWIRVIPGHDRLEDFERMAKDVQDVADEVVLVQFRSNVHNDAPFEDITEPGPGEERLRQLAMGMIAWVKSIRIIGKGFDERIGRSI